MFSGQRDKLCTHYARETWSWAHCKFVCIAYKYESNIVFVVLLRPNAKEAWHILSFLKCQSNLPENFLNFQRKAVITEMPWSLCLLVDEHGYVPPGDVLSHTVWLICWIGRLPSSHCSEVAPGAHFCSSSRQPLCIYSCLDGWD